MKIKKHETVTGLDIGSYSVKCVEVVRTEQAIELHRAVILPVTDESDARQCIQTLALGGAPHVRVALSGSSVIIRRISMPLLNPRELQGAIRFEAESHIPFSIDDCMLDYQVLKQDTAKKEMSIMLVAAKRDLVDSRYKLLSELAIRPELMDLDIFCLVNAFQVLNPEHGEKTFGLLNVGHKVSSFAIIHEGLPAFVREIPFGGFSVTKVLAENKGCAEEEADRIKRVRSAGEEDILKSATQKGFERLSEEIRHSIDYVENEIKEDVKKIYVSGGGALAAGAPEVLARDTARPVSFWDHTQKMKLDGKVSADFMKERSAELIVALGMTLRGLGGSRR